MKERAKLINKEIPHDTLSPNHPRRFTLGRIGGRFRGTIVFVSAGLNVGSATITSKEGNGANEHYENSEYQQPSLRRGEASQDRLYDTAIRCNFRRNFLVQRL